MPKNIGLVQMIDKQIIMYLELLKSTNILKGKMTDDEEKFILKMMQ